MAKPKDSFSSEQRAVIRSLLIGIKRAWNAPPDTKEENRAVDAIIDMIERLKDLD